jgi:hypothetical protein
MPILKLMTMKSIKSLLLILMLFLGISVMASDTLYYRYNNYYVKPGSPKDTLIFDVEIRSSTLTTYLVGVQVDVQFNTAVFGINAKPVVVQRLALVANNPPYNLEPGVANPATNKFRWACSQLLPPYNIGTLSLVPTTTWGKLVRFKMLVNSNAQDAGILFDIAAMSQTQYFCLVTGNTKYKYAPVVAWNDLVNMPTTLTVLNLMISEVGAPMSPNNNAMFIEIYNPGDNAVDFSIFPWYITQETNGTTRANIQLTGLIGADGTYVIAHDQTNFVAAGFTADQYSTVINNGGGETYVLSNFGEYSVGTTVDIYGQIGSTGSGQPWYFANSHAVRHYPVVNPNLTWTASEWVISGAENIDLTPGSHRTTLTWNGSSSNVWRARDNWTANFVPDAGHNVTIPGTVGTFAHISNGDNAYTNDLDIGTPVVRTGAALTIESTPSGDGSLITYGTVTGLADVKRYVSADRYRYVSSPVSNGVSGVFLHIWMWTYNEATGSWGPWIVPVNVPLNVMQGYAVWTSSINPWHAGEPPLGDTTTMYNNGPLNNGNLSIALTNTASGGWNFVGNPYVSALDWTLGGWTKTNLMTNAFHVWNGTGYSGYTVGSGGYNGGTKYIPAQQGFFVRSAVGGGLLGVSNQARVHSTQAFWKSEELFSNRLSLTISNGTTTDETVIYFNQNATTGLDYQYDATKLLATVSPQLFTMTGDQKMAINTFNNPVETPAVIMGYTIPDVGQFTLTASNIESFDAGLPIYLEDLKDNKIINLRETTSYTFSVASTQEDPLRFIIHFADPQGINDPDNVGVNNIYAYNRDVYVNYSGNHGEIVIYNLVGQEIIRKAAVNGLNKIAVPQGNAAYVVKVIGNNSSVSEKVFVR